MVAHERACSIVALEYNIGALNVDEEKVRIIGEPGVDRNRSRYGEWVWGNVMTTEQPINIPAFFPEPSLMAETTPTAQAVLLREGASVLQSLDILASQAMTADLLRGLGFDFPDADFPDSLTGIATDLQGIRTAVTDLAAAQTDEEQTSRASTLLSRITTLVPKIAALPDEFKDALDDYQDFRDNSGIEDDLLRRLLDLIIVIYLSTSHPSLYRTMTLLGLTDWVDQGASTARHRLATRIARVEWERIPLLFSDPLELASQAYDWGDDFKADLFSARLGLLLHSLGVPAVPVAQDPRLMTALGRPTTDDTAWRLTLLREGAGPAIVEAGLDMSASPPRDRPRRAWRSSPTSRARSRSTPSWAASTSRSAARWRSTPASRRSCARPTTSTSSGSC